MRRCFTSFLLCGLSALCAAATQPQSTSPSADWASAFIPKEMLPKLPEITTHGPPEDIVKDIPDHILRGNDRFFTISIENDFFGSGADRDYTNGIRFTYFNVGTDQPRLMYWLDEVIPTFDINKTSTTYYSFGQNLYTPHDIATSEYIPNDRPYAAFLYGSAGMSTITGNHMDDVELTLGVVGPAALGREVQREFHRLKGVQLPNGWSHQLHNEPGIIVSWERSYPQYYSARIGDSVSTGFTPHYGITLGNVYTYANAGFNIDLTPQSMPWQSQPVRVRPAIPGSGFFETPDSGHSWQLFAGVDGRWMVRNIFLDGNTFGDSHDIKKRPFVFDLALGAAYTYEKMRVTYTYNWRTKEFYSPYARTSGFGSISLSYRF